MHFVYIIQSRPNRDQYYVSCTDDIERRLSEHNRGKSTHTRKFTPWNIVSYHYFTDKQKAFEFEKYLKSGSGRAFANKRLK